jgi:uncharacterized MAPEG superfamily protein
MPNLAFELKMLLAATAIGFVQLLIAAAAARRQQPLDWAMGSRDEAMPPLTGVAGRLDRANRNFLETFVFFLAAVLAVYLGGHAGHALSVWGCVLYVAARALYVPLYAAGTRGLRSLVWGVSMLGIVLVAVAALA